MRRRTLLDPSTSDLLNADTAGAEAEWQKRMAPPMSREELERVLRRYTGDL